MKLITGLGNPGIKYEHTRHNAGFKIIDYIADKFHIPVKDKKNLWTGGKGSYENEEFYLLKPSTYMNNSGEAISRFIDENNISLKDLLVIVDDFQLPFGTIRLRAGGSDGGHNGLASINYHLMTEEYPRMRVGIGRGALSKDEYIDFVLDEFDSSEMSRLKELMPEYSDCVMSFISRGITETMNKFNRSFL